MLSTFTVPIGLGNITWRFYIIFIAWVMIEFVGVWLVFPETKGPSLEEIAYIFDGPQGVVGHAAEVMVEVFFEHHRQAFGIAGTKPRITWRFEGTVSDWEQSAYDIEVARNGPKVDKTALFSFNSSNSLYVPWPDEELGESEAATVRVRDHGIDGLSTPWSDWVNVETGLLTEGSWVGAVPITADIFDQSNNTAKRPLYFRRDFQIPQAIASARLRSTGRGLAILLRPDGSRTTTAMSMTHTM
ncbi:hypothetical protein FPSE5266_05713 [Fusarium pseudograminearum]|nr:hypothetical protein FPSE5266_05713 [Fusarium pseudograminearum]